MDNRELDKWIAENVMGWSDFPHPYVNQVFRPTESISDAFQVVEKLKEDDFWFSCSYKSPGPGYYVRFRCVRGATRKDKLGFDNSLPLAICLAAKKAGVSPSAREAKE